MIVPLAIVLALVTAPALRGPEVDAQCLHSPFRLGTDNVPVGNGRATTVVNIWAMVDSNQKPALAWVYKNASNDYFLQGNARRANALRRLPSSLSSKTLDRRTKRGGIIPLPFFAQQELLAEFAAIGAQEVRCFATDLPQNDY